MSASRKRVVGVTATRGAFIRSHKVECGNEEKIGEEPELSMMTFGGKKHSLHCFSREILLLRLESHNFYDLHPIHHQYANASPLTF